MGDTYMPTTPHAVIYIASSKIIGPINAYGNNFVIIGYGCLILNQQDFCLFDGFNTIAVIMMSIFYIEKICNPICVKILTCQEINHHSL